MSQESFQWYRMKPHCVAGGVTWWQEGGVYPGRAGAGEVGTIRLWSPDGVESLEVLRGSVVMVEAVARGL